MKTNRTRKPVKPVLRSETTTTVSHQGGEAVIENAQKELARAVSCCMLYEDSFYEKGSSLAERIDNLVADSSVTAKFLGELAIKARTDLKLRHIPLYLMVQGLKHHKVGWRTIAEVIQRADELAEIIALYWKDGKKPIASQLKLGVAAAFDKFKEYHFAKYNRDSEVKLRDVMFLTHPKPVNKERKALYRNIANNTLAIPDTWETALSSGADRRETFERLIDDGRLGYMALLRNLRNMEEAGVSQVKVKKALIAGAEGSMALPFRFITAAKHAPAYRSTLSDCMLFSLKSLERLNGPTVILVDVSGSMAGALSNKSEVNRIEAAAALAAMIQELAEKPSVYVFQSNCMRVNGLRGMELIDAIIKAPRGGTQAGRAIRLALKDRPDAKRVIVVTDEQSEDSIPELSATQSGYIINVATYKPALPDKRKSWVHISGFSERIIDWIREEER